MTPIKSFTQPLGATDLTTFTLRQWCFKSNRNRSIKSFISSDVQCTWCKIVRKIPGLACKTPILGLLVRKKSAESD